MNTKTIKTNRFSDHEIRRNMYIFLSIKFMQIDIIWFLGWRCYVSYLSPRH